MQITELPTTERWSEFDWEQVLWGAVDWSSVRLEDFRTAGVPGSLHDPITAADVSGVIWLTADSPEGYGSVDMSALLTLTDGTFAVVVAWADTTGWGCRDGINWKVGPTLDSVVGYLDAEVRTRYYQETSIEGELA